MKKIILGLTILLLVAPAMATTCNIQAVVEYANSGTGIATVRIDYVASGTPKVRAFALDLSVDSGATISDINDYFVGECNETDRGYGIFMGNIAITGGAVTDYGSPVAPATAPDDPCQLGSDGIVVEMGSLYVDDNSPGDNETLCRLTIDAGGNDCNLVIAEETLRGGVVLEDPAQSLNDTNLPVTIHISFDCYTGPDKSEWETVGKPDSWCNPRQCHGDADGILNKYGPGNMWSAWVNTEDISILIKGFRQPYSGDPAVDGGDPDSDPDTWIAADFDHTNNKYGPGNMWSARVNTEDISILIWHFRNAHGVPPADCLSGSPSSP